MPHLGYARWENGENAVRKARSACRNAGHEVSDHFRDITKMIDIGKGGQRAASDVQMTRFGCYLVAMNGDPDKPEVAAAQQYFAVALHNE
jgi:DNA-damage-inducible protein D